MKTYSIIKTGDKVEKIKVEICCGTIEDVLTASLFDVDRIELNSALELGGLTPTSATLKMAKRSTQIPIMCMVRPRCAGFVYSKAQIENMFSDAKMLLDDGTDGIVFGFLNQNHTVDKGLSAKMVELIHSYGKEAVFHKAFDECENLEKALLDLIDLGVDRVLSAGGKGKIEEGSVVLGRLQKKYGDRIEILPGGGITPDNICRIAENVKSGQIHMSAKKKCYDEGEFVAVDGLTLRKALEQLRQRKG